MTGQGVCFVIHIDISLYLLVSNIQTLYCVTFCTTTTYILQTYTYVSFVRTASPSKKLSQQDCPTVALAKYEKPGAVSIVCTTKMTHVMVVYDSKFAKDYVHLLNDKYGAKYTVDGIRQLCGLKGKTQTIYCCVMSHVEVCAESQIVECRLRFGWGQASIPIFVAKSIDHWIKKRKLDDTGDHAADETQSMSKKALTSQSCSSSARAADADAESVGDGDGADDDYDRGDEPDESNELPD